MGQQALKTHFIGSFLTEIERLSTQNGSEKEILGRKEKKIVN